jgi:hypothetical protein
MKQNTISTLPSLDITRYERLFDVYEDTDGLYYYNLLQTVNFNQTNLDPSIYSIYTVLPGDSFPFISYKLYKTINLWWLVCSFNNIHDPTKLPVPSTQLKILNIEFVNNILNNIS